MFRNIFRKSKNIKLGRWNTNKKSDTINRQIDLANCDSCGTCGINDSKSIKIKIRLPLTSKRNFSSNFKSPDLMFIKIRFTQYPSTLLACY